MYHLRSDSGSNGLAARECHRFLIAGLFNVWLFPSKRNEAHADDRGFCGFTLTLPSLNDGMARHRRNIALPLKCTQAMNAFWLEAFAWFVLLGRLRCGSLRCGGFQSCVNAEEAIPDLQR
jgi:hypothetical protein